MISEQKKLLRLRFQIVETFNAWIKLKLPDEVFANLVNECPHLLELVFQELYSADEENLSNAVTSIVELITLSRKRPDFASIL
jgi:hypothetical protein